MAAIEILDPSCRKISLDRGRVSELENILATSFADLDDFFELEAEKRVLEELLLEHSSIAMTPDSADDERLPKEPRLFFQTLNMSLNVQKDGTGWFRYFLEFNEADGKKLEADYDTEYPELTIQSINSRLTGQRFVELYYGLWFLVPNSLSVDKLNATLAGACEAKRPPDS